MLKKITFERRLGIDSRERKWRGLKIVTVAGLVAFSGGAIAFSGFGKLGYWIVLLGFAGGVVGMVIHFYALITEILKKKQ